ncbi:MAG: NACHT domain protein, partial [Dolichospermum sp.]
NILFLPRNLPQNVYFFLTRRHYRTDRERRLFTEVDTPQHELDLRQMENKSISQDDIKKCIRLFLNEDEQFSPKL